MAKYLFALFVAMAIPMVAFAGGTQEKQSAGPVTLTLWFPAGEITADTLPFRDTTDPFAQFEAQNNCKINLVPVDYDTMRQKILTALAGGKAPDIGFVDDSWIGVYISDGSIVQIPDADAKAWLSAVSPEIVALSNTGGGKMYGYPSWGIDAYALTWNKDIFQEVGLDPNTPPKYWQDFREDSKKTAIANSDGTMKRVGYAIRHLGEPAGIVDKWDWLIEGAGGKLNTDPTALKGGSVLLDTPDMVAGFQMAHDMVWVDKSTSLNFPDPRDAFLKGIAAFQISELVSIQVRQPKEAPNLNWGFAPAPAKAPGSSPSVHISAWDTVVFSQSAEKNLALKAIQWYNSVDNDYAQAKKYNSTPRYLVNWDKAPFTTDAMAQQFKSLLPYGRPYPLTLSLSHIMDATGTSIQKILHDEEPVEQALKEAQDKGNAALQQQ